MPFSFRHLVLERALAVLELETTGVDARNDRIVEVGVVKLALDAEAIRYRRLVHPGIPIPGSSIAIHGDHRRGRRRAAAVPDDRAPAGPVAGGRRPGGFNVRRFDLPFLAAEFSRAEVEFRLGDRAVLDAQQNLHQHEPRDLAAAMRFYCGRVRGAAHGALADAEVAAAILDAQVARSADLPPTVA
jgi:DNA polymerase-3 subunit epsilon